MNDYQQEQWDGNLEVQRYLKRMPAVVMLEMIDGIAPYLAFRRRVDRFLDRHCSDICTQACFQSRTSACCSKDGIITFWADLVINALSIGNHGLNRLLESIRHPRNAQKCIYLGSNGCLWRIRPLVCAMFLCDQVQSTLYEDGVDEELQWSEMMRQAKSFRWPDRPVLFDQLEKPFIELGCRSSLMYLHNSPGLLMIKKKAGLT